MADISHQFGSDLQVDATGDIAASDGSQLGQERVLRRLLSNPGSYLWWLDYGAGLARFIGRPVAPRRIAAITRAQMFREAAVAQIPLPTVTISVSKDGTFTENVSYVDANTGSTVVLTLPVGD